MRFRGCLHHYRHHRLTFQLVPSSDWRTIDRPEPRQRGRPTAFDPIDAPACRRFGFKADPAEAGRELTLGAMACKSQPRNSESGNIRRVTFVHIATSRATKQFENASVVQRLGDVTGLSRWRHGGGDLLAMILLFEGIAA